MNTEISGIILMYALVIVIAIPLGRYIGKVFSNESTWPDRLFNPIDRAFYKLAGVDPTREMTWKQHLLSLLTFNLVWFILGMFVLMNMSWLMSLFIFILTIIYNIYLYIYIILYIIYLDNFYFLCKKKIIYVFIIFIF